MPGGFDEKTEKTELERVVGKSPEAERFIALCTTAPTKNTNGTAAAYTGYKRSKTTAASWKAAEGAGASASSITNAAEVAFPECTGGESKVRWFEIWTAESGGERLLWGELKEEVTISPTKTPPKFAAGQLEVTLS